MAGVPKAGVPKRPFCPQRDCGRRCTAANCTCKPCFCSECQERSRRARFGRLKPYEPPAPNFSSPTIQMRLTAARPKEVRPVRPQQLKYRQGDVLIVERTEPIPTDAAKVPLEDGRLVLAHGEVTGHAHVIVGEAELFTPADLQDLERRFLAAEREVELVHDEHGTITLPPTPHGYDVLRQREYTPEAIRRVAD